MKVGQISNPTRVLGQAQGFVGLPVRDELVSDGAGWVSSCMVSEWQPDTRDLALLAKGAPIRIKILGTSHPPILVEVGEAP